MATRRKKHRKQKNKDKSPPLTPEQLENAADQSLASARFREAIGHFKALLKTEERSQWREGLEAAYRGRALELTAKGMLNEALVIWENHRQLAPDTPMACEHIALLYQTGRVIEAVRGYRQALDQLGPKEGPKELAGLRSQFAVVYLIDRTRLEEQVSPDDPVIVHGVQARNALEAYCRGDDRALELALESIPYRSPYRDWAQILKGLQKLPQDPIGSERLLSRISPDSPFTPIMRASQLALKPEPEFLTGLTELDDASSRFAIALRGWPERRLKLWGELHRLGDSPKPEAMFRWLFQHRDLLGEDWVHQHALRLMIGEYSNSFNWFPKDARPSPLERDLVAAWNMEDDGDPWQIFDAWVDVIRHLTRPVTPQPESDDALRIALIQRRLDSRWHLLGMDSRELVDDFDNLPGATLAGLEESLRLDPDDRPTYLRLIGYYRGHKSLKDARRLLDLALERWPEDLGILVEALETAVAGNAFKKAAGFARRILKLDPVNARARDSLLEAHLSHARKQIHRGRSDLTRKELRAAGEWAQGEKSKARLDLLRGLFFMDENPHEGKALLVGATQALGGGIAGRLDLALEIQRLDLSPGPLMKKLDLPIVKCPEKDDLLAFLRRLREHLDKETEIPQQVLRYFASPLKAGSKRQLTRQESESVCETLRRCGLDGARLAHAQAALKRWPELPVFELHALEAKHEGSFWGVSETEIERLENALEHARTAGDKRTVLRIQEALHEATILPPQSRRTSLEPESGMPDINDEMALELFLDLLEKTGMLPPGFRELEQELGRDALLELLEGLDDGEFSNPWEALLDLPEPPRPKRRKKASGSSASRKKNKNKNSSDSASPFDQLDLFE